MWRLDYLFFRVPSAWQVNSRRMDRTFGSDHHPLVGTVASAGSAAPTAP
jgi:endonuclease/exonuclease/phosphatase (EEP) superfamily protein YafD